MQRTLEANFDGLVGPTHNYAGLSFGNVASQNNENSVANPKAAARQGLRKMKRLADLGFAQGVLPPQERPSIRLLRELGFGGNDAAAIAKAAKEAPELLAAASSASAMWTANAATVSPSADTPDARVHFTPANLCSKLHRAIEHEATRRTLTAIFADPARFVVHDALPGTPALGDEGAANHTRFCAQYGAPGVEFFVYGRSEFRRGPEPKRYPARQTFEASRAVAQRHGLADDATVFAQQNPDVIDAGVFHNDVIAVGNRGTLFCHERAFVGAQTVYDELRAKLAARDAPFDVIEVPDAQVSVADAVSSYLFNSQLLSRAEGSQVLVVPQECRENPWVAIYLDDLVAKPGPIGEVLAFDLRESMKNGGGPACLRLRVVLNDAERAAVAPGVWIDDKLFERLDAWIERHYRDRLAPADLADPALLDESRTALDELTQILGLGSLYDFQR
ncbi:N-succinylarginine dihydrolase [Paraburkholderia caballeronis]|uniref:N-succinylarginine dihydrolase n=1 Tax=Paraburkholderia caballeronis TaxID=416943 RepID=A0A1H7K702_9BURK|nr:N-succinylarginine dihydrolase [Paraburkholderia caballeronis]PXW27104.1 succinylarginine dihydrolase [Paraburkholderia caballeronis]PXX02578.1 succinylarginine dihydrolase [Paraburkholderia caballeronis]RAK03303.1 succinylarginine dihydrolase [Paraburkholderia caballeronis]SEC48915.1 succinylarginine dihydrolase [Paraburkholderia caballeronis]SEK82286.1 succinylarginine dihydrolase [Paraburkholderia caballeronis]